MKLGKYKHFKGGEYELLGVTFHSETQEKFVLYKPLYECEMQGETSPYFVRPYDMFFEDVEFQGNTQARFAYIGKTI